MSTAVQDRQQQSITKEILIGSHSLPVRIFLIGIKWDRRS